MSIEKFQISKLKAPHLIKGGRIFDDLVSASVSYQGVDNNCGKGVEGEP